MGSLFLTELEKRKQGKNRIYTQTMPVPINFMSIEALRAFSGHFRPGTPEICRLLCAGEKFGKIF